MAPAYLPQHRSSNPMWRAASFERQNVPSPCANGWKGATLLRRLAVRNSIVACQSIPTTGAPCILKWECKESAGRPHKTKKEAKALLARSASEECCQTFLAGA